MLNKWKIDNFFLKKKALHSLRIFEMVFRYFHVMTLMRCLELIPLIKLEIVMDNGGMTKKKAGPQLQIMLHEIIAFSCICRWKNCKAMSGGNWASFGSFDNKFYYLFKMWILHTLIIHTVIQYFNGLIMDSCHLCRR